MSERCCLWAWGELIGKGQEKSVWAYGTVLDLDKTRPTEHVITV